MNHSPAPMKFHPDMLRGNPVLFVCGIVLVPFGVGILLLALIWLRSVTDVMTIDGRDLSISSGILSRHSVDIAIGNIRSVRVDQSLLDRMFDVGMVSIFTAGDAPEGAMRGLRGPNAIRRHLLAARDRAK